MPLVDIYISVRPLQVCSFNYTGQYQSLEKRNGQQYRPHVFFFHYIKSQRGGPEATKSSQMKKQLLLLLGALIALPTLARDFTYTYEGQTLTYTVLDEDAKTCKTKAGNVATAGGNNVSGDLYLPEYPKYGEIEYTLTAIGESAFVYCYDLTSVFIPNSITTIGNGAFGDCTGLTEIYALPTVPPSVRESTFYDVPRDIDVYVPKGTIPTYSAAEVWSEFTNYHEIEGLDSIEDLEADNCNASAEYFTLQGQRVSADHVTTGVYIVRSGDKITKTYIR